GSPRPAPPAPRRQSPARPSGSLGTCSSPPAPLSSNVTARVLIALVPEHRAFNSVLDCHHPLALYQGRPMDAPILIISLNSVIVIIRSPGSSEPSEDKVLRRSAGNVFGYQRQRAVVRRTRVSPGEERTPCGCPSALNSASVSRWSCC